VTTRTRLLLVEDNPGDARLLRAELPKDFQITHVERLSLALAALKAEPRTGWSRASTC
jgi:hypothetical protein